MDKVNGIVYDLNTVLAEYLEYLFHLLGVRFALDGEFFAHFVVGKVSVNFADFDKALDFVLDLFAAVLSGGLSGNRLDTLVAQRAENVVDVLGRGRAAAERRVHVVIGDFALGLIFFVKRFYDFV